MKEDQIRTNDGAQHTELHHAEHAEHAGHKMANDENMLEEHDMPKGHDMSEEHHGHMGHDMPMGHHMPGENGEHAGHTMPSGHGAHTDHTGHEMMFRRKFWVSLVLSVPGFNFFLIFVYILFLIL